MSLLSVILTLVVVGLLLWLINQFIPMDAKVKQILNVAVIVILVLWLLSVFFGFDLSGVREVKVPTVR
jgi:hypothetical protein